MSAAWEANPHGNWDAWSIWNLRAKFLAAGDGLMARAWSPKLNFTHPDYPLLLSGFIASCWSDSGVVSTLAPTATSYVFFLALLALLTGGMAALRGGPTGLLAGLCIMAVPALLAEVPAQYADVPLACFFAGAVLCALLERPALAGAFAACAAWTKDEGLLFLVVVFGAVAVFQPRAFLRFLCGAAPVALLVFVFKFVMAGGTPSLLHGFRQLTDLGRYRATAAAMAGQIFAWRSGWYHPVLPVVVSLIGLGLERKHVRAALFCAAVVLAMVAGYFGVYVVTPNELQWQLQTSLNRLFVQLTPLVVIAAFAATRAPEPVAPPQPKTRRKGRR
jgi:hypothetical protein